MMRLFSFDFDAQKYKKVNGFLSKWAAAAFRKRAASTSTSVVRIENGFQSSTFQRGLS
jgi:hypothetical protein